MVIAWGLLVVLCLLTILFLSRALRAAHTMLREFGGARVVVHIDGEDIFDGTVSDHVMLMMWHDDESCTLADAYGVHVKFHLRKGD